MTARLTPVEPAHADAHTHRLFDAIKARNGKVPNMMKTMAHSPALLEGYLAVSGALSKGVLPEVIRQQIALFVSQVLLARQGQAQDPKQQAVLTLVQNILDQRGDVSDEQFAAARAAGLNDGEIAEVVGHVALTTLTNFFNQLAQPVLDFPRVPASVQRVESLPA
jgi:alkylhydroperoxidase family enzyme